MRSIPLALLASLLLAACGGSDGGGSTSAGGGAGGGAGGAAGGGVMAAPGPVSPLDAAASGLLASAPDQPAIRPATVAEPDPLNPAAGSPAATPGSADQLPLNRSQLPPVPADPDKPNA